MPFKIKTCVCPDCANIFSIPSQNREEGGCGKKCPNCGKWIYGKSLTKAHKYATEIPSNEFCSTSELAMEFGMSENEASSIQNKLERMCGNVLKLIK